MTRPWSSWQGGLLLGALGPEPGDQVGRLPFLTATIPFDSSPHKVVAFRGTVPVQLRYVATPALGNSPMLQGAIVNTTGFPVLEGGVALFVDGSFVGSAAVPDDALSVERSLLSRTVKGSEAFRQS